MDTSAPWGEEKAAAETGWATFEQQGGGGGERSGGDGGSWADFSTLASAGGEGFGRFPAFPAEDDNANKQGEYWFTQYLSNYPHIYWVTHVYMNWSVSFGFGVSRTYTSGK